MIDKLCSDLERKALLNGHDIGNGFVEKPVLGVPMLQLSCSACGLLVVVAPSTGRHMEIYAGGRCCGSEIPNIALGNAGDHY